MLDAAPIDALPPQGHALEIGVGPSQAPSDPEKNKATIEKALAAYIKPRAVGVLARRYIWRMTTAPLQCQMRHIHIINSDKWERQQQAQATKEEVNPQNGLMRDFRILVCARGNLEDRVLMQLRALFMDERLWFVIKQDDFTNAARCLAFKSISGAGSNTDKKFARKHKRFPFLVFREFDSPVLGELVDSMPDCLKDLWSLERCKDGEYKTLDGRARTLLCCMLIYFSNFRCEVGFAHFRRWVCSRNETHCIDLADLDSHWLSGRFRSSLAFPEEKSSSE